VFHRNSIHLVVEQTNPYYSHFCKQVWMHQLSSQVVMLIRKHSVALFTVSQECCCVSVTGS
jgi:hypothetical protein